MKTVIIQNTEHFRARLNVIQEAIARGLNGGPIVVEIKRQRRTLSQNAKLWALLDDISSQVEWYGGFLTKEDWKEIFTASLRKQKAVPGIDRGSTVILGCPTHSMEKEEFSDLLELIQAFGAEHDVTWSAPAIYD